MRSHSLLLRPSHAYCIWQLKEKLKPFVYAFSSRERIAREFVIRKFENWIVMNIQPYFFRAYFKVQLLKWVSSLSCRKRVTVFSKMNACWGSLYNKNNAALRTLMAYINFVDSCLSWHALFTESRANYVAGSFHHLMLSLFVLRRFTFVVDAFLLVFKALFSWNV